MLLCAGLNYIQCWYHALFVCHPLVIFVKEKVIERLEGGVVSHVVYMQVRRWKKVFSPGKKPVEKFHILLGEWFSAKNLK